jgi:hypothetical protein
LVAAQLTPAVGDKSTGFSARAAASGLAIA